MSKLFAEGHRYDLLTGEFEKTQSPAAEGCQGEGRMRGRGVRVVKDHGEPEIKIDQVYGCLDGW